MRTERLLCLRNQSDLALGGKNYEPVDEKLVHPRPLFSNISSSTYFLPFASLPQKDFAIIYATVER